jgi:hypothetical protein
VLGFVVAAVAVIAGTWVVRRHEAVLSAHVERIHAGPEPVGGNQPEDAKH